MSRFSPPTRPASLAALSRAESGWAKELSGIAWRFECAAVAFALATVATTNTIVIVTAATLAILCVITGRVISYRRKVRYLTSERARRALLIIDGQDVELSPAEQSQLQARFSATARKRASEEKDRAPRISPSGAWRLRLLVQKDAFWTAGLCRGAARAFHPLVIAYPLIVLVLIVSLAMSVDEGPEVLICRIIALAVALWLGGEGLGAYLSFWRAAADVESIDKALEDKPPDAPLAAILPALRDYDVVVAALPSIPRYVIKREQARLHQIWQSRVLQYRQ